MSKPHGDNQPEATTYFQLQRNRDGLPEPGEEKPAPVMPALPSTSPWSSDPCGPEPLIDRREDADFIITGDEGDDYGQD
jgi:hypothetical protein